MTSPALLHSFVVFHTTTSGMIHFPIPHPCVPEILVDSLRTAGFAEKGRDLAPVILVALMILSWPVAVLIRYIRNPTFRMITSLLVGVLMMVGVYGAEVSLGFVLVTVGFYIPCRYQLLSPGWTTFSLLAFLLIIHYDSMLTGTATDRVAYTGTLMMIVAKLSMFSFHISDGSKLLHKLSLSDQHHIAQQRELTAIDPHTVNLSRFLCYIFEFMGGLVGPLFTYAEYMDFIHSRKDFAHMHSQPILRPSLHAIARAVIALGLYLLFQQLPHFGLPALTSPWLLSLPFVFRLLLSCFMAAVARLAYASVWAMSEVACTISGLSYTPDNGFTRGRNVNLFAVETSTSFSQITTNWNIRIADLWLKQCIYQRIEVVPSVLRPLFKHRRGLANLTTKITSASWHGWYVGYHMSFISLGIANWSETLIKQRLLPYVPSRIRNSPIAPFLAWAHTWCSLNAFFVPFLVLTSDRTVVYNNSIYWCAHVYHFAIIIVATLVSPPKLEKSSKQKE